MEPEEMEENQEQYVDEKPSMCCSRCKWFDPRPCFCRLNPPVPTNMTIGGFEVIKSNFPKINIPDLDWCSHFEEH